MALSDTHGAAIRAAHAAQAAARKLGPHQPSPDSAPKVLDAGDGRAPTALVSWAHRGEDWSDEESAAWTQEVVEFAGALRANGIDADLDLFHADDANVDWTRFGPRAVMASEFVVVAISDAWAQRWAGTNSPSVGAGAVAEADALKGLFQKDQSAWQRKVVVVVLPSQSAESIPDDLMRATRFWVDPDQPDTIETLLRTLTGQPQYEKPKLERVPVLPPAVAATLGVKEHRKQSPTESEFEDYTAVLNEVKQAPAGDKVTARMSLLMGLLDALSS